MKFTDWVAKSGGRVVVARQLGVTPEAIHYWFAGKSTPRWETIFKVVELSRGKVTAAAIFEETRVRERCKAARSSR